MIDILLWRNADKPRIKLITQDIHLQHKLISTVPSNSFYASYLLICVEFDSDFTRFPGPEDFFLVFCDCDI